MPRRKTIAAIVSAVMASGAAFSFAQQAVITQIAAMPYIPVNYQSQNYTAIAQGFDSTVFNPVAQSTYQYKTFWFQNDSENGISQGFGMPSYVGQTQASEGNGEAITTIAAVLGASLVGINKQSQTLSNGNTYDFVQMASRYYDSGTGANLVLNNIGSQGTGSFWYDQLPQILFDGLVSQYYSSYAPGSAGQQRLDTIMTNSAAKMHAVIDVLAGNSTTAVPNFNYQGFNYVTMQPVTGDHTEPDGAGGAAYEQYMAYIHTGNATDLSDAERCIQALQNTPASQNPLYETILPFGALTAARLNAEQGTNYDVAKMVNWCFSPTSVVRSGWGAISASQWGGYGAAGLIGSTTDQGGYGFAMNSYLYPMALVPLVRYDDRFANSIGQWMLNLTNSARMFLKSDLPASNQTNATWNDAPSNYYSYEGVKESSGGVTPLAGGDGTGYNSSWLNFAYGSGDVGVLGSIVSQTNVSMILQLNLLATDFFHAGADPSYLLYNPYNTMKTVQVNVGSSPVNIYDAISDQFLATNVSGVASISIPGESSRSLVYTPVGGALVDNGTGVSVNGVVVNYRSPELNRDYWDLNGTTAGAGGSTLSGTWDSTTTNWNPSSAGTSSTTAWTTGRVAMFSAGTDGGGTYTVTVSGTQTIGGLYFQNGNVTLTGGNFTLASDSTFTAASGVQTINTPIAGAFAFLKDGPGTVVLGAVNTYTGITTIEAGVLQLGNAYALDFTNVDVDVNNGLNINSLNASLGGLSGSGNVNISNQTLTVGNDNQAAEYAGNLSGAGEVIKIGTGIWTLDNPNSYSGGTILRGGEISVAADASLGNATSALNFDGGTLQITGTTFTSTPRSITMTSNGSGFDIEDPNNTFTVSQNLSGGNLSKYGVGTLALTGTNSLAGLTLNAGTLSAANASNLGGGSITFGGGTLSLGNNSPLTLAAGVTVNSSSTLNLAGTATVAISGSFAINAALVQTGNGTLQLTSLPTGSGSITLRAGTLLANINSNWAIGGTTGAGGIYIADASSNSTDNQSLLLGSGVTMSYGRLYFQPYALGGTKTLGSDSTSGVATINTYIQLESSSINLQLTAPPGGQFNLPLGILGSNAAGITITGGGTISLGGVGAAQSEYYQGTTIVQNGTLLLTGSDIVGNARDSYVLGNSSYAQAVQIGNAATPPSAQLSFLTDAAVTINHNISVNNFGGSVYLGGASANTSTFNSALSLSKNIFLTSATSGVVNFTGNITGTGGITVKGTGTVNLSGVNGYTGTTNISSGSALLIAAAGALPSGNVISNNGNLTINANNFADAITGTGTLTIGPSVAMRLAPLGQTNSQNALSIPTNSSLDIADNNFLVTYNPNPDPISSISGYLASGYAHGTWAGPGIISSAAAADNGLTTLGYTDTNSQILIKYTWIGDLNLDGIVNAADLTSMAPNNTTHATWSQGDFNYDGIVNADDYALFMLGLTASSGANISTTLPEPAPLSIIALNARLRPGSTQQITFQVALLKPSFFSGRKDLEHEFTRINSNGHE